MSATARLDHDPADQLPRALGNYLLLHEVARGGMGKVYLARTGGALEGIEKFCVVKTLRPEYTTDREYVDRFVEEARIVVLLTHRNICPVFDVGVTNTGQYYLAMELIPGRDLRAILARSVERGERVPEAVALHLVSETLEALDYAHRLRDPATGEPLGLVHRDVSPANVMVNLEGEVKLIDFGLARIARGSQKSEIESGGVFGKLAYMSPEHMRGDVIDGRTDLFAAAVLAYEVLTGDRYYAGIAEAQIWAAASLGEFKPRRWGDLDPELQRILSRALDPNPARRHTDCGELRDDLLAYEVQKHWRAGAREVRAFFQGLFPEDEREQRVLISRAKTLRPAADVGEFAEIATTQTIARAPTTSVSGKIDDSTLTISTAVAPSAPFPVSQIRTDVVRTRHDEPEPAPSRAPFLASAVAVVVLVAAGGIFFLRSSTTHPEALPDPPPVLASSTPSAPRAPRALNTPSTPSAPPDRAPMLAPDRAPEIGAGADPAAASPPPTSTSASRPKRPRAVAAPPPPPPGTWKAKLDWLRQHCTTRTRCASQLPTNLASMSKEQVDAFKDGVNRCVAECQ